MGTGDRHYPVASSLNVGGQMRWPLWRVAVAEQSMAPSLWPGDWLLVWRGLRPGRPPRVRPGQIVVARHPARADFLVVKRATRPSHLSFLTRLP